MSRQSAQNEKISKPDSKSFGSSIKFASNKSEPSDAKNKSLKKKTSSLRPISMCDETSNKFSNGFKKSTSWSKLKSRLVYLI